MPRSKKPRFKPKKAAPQDPLVKAFQAQDHIAFRRSAATALAEEVLTEARIQTAAKGVPAEHAGDFITAVHAVAGNVMSLGPCPDTGEAVMFRTSAFAMTVTTDADEILAADVSEHLEAAIAASGLFDEDGVVLVAPRPYALPDLTRLSALSVFSACRSVMEAKGDLDAEAVAALLPAPDPAPLRGEHTLTFVGFRFAPVKEGVEEMFDRRFSTTDEAEAAISAYYDRTDDIFGMDASVSPVVPWDSAVGNAVAERLSAASYRVDEEVRADPPQVMMSGETAAFRFVAPNGDAFEVSVPSAALIRAWPHIDLWLQEAYPDPGEEEEAPKIATDFEGEPAFGAWNDPDPQAEPDTTNIVRFPGRGR